jgi:hypothetical protein
MVPTNFLGPLTITAIALDGNGNYDVKESVVSILPGANLTLKSISVNPFAVETNLSFSQIEIPQDLEVIGNYSDGIARDITLGGAGTTYSSSDSAVAVVDIDGHIRAAGNGSAQIKVVNAGHTAQVGVQVRLLPPTIMSIRPDHVEPGVTNVTITITGMNFGGASGLSFLRDGQPDHSLTIGGFINNANANLQVVLSAPQDAVSGLLTAVVSTPSGTSSQTPVQGNRFFIGPGLVMQNPRFTSGGQGQTNRFGFTLVGTTGSKAIVQASNDLVTWLNETTNTLTFGSSSFVETNLTGDLRYYRALGMP